MSGIEVAGLVFGVVPILIEAVKSYRVLTEKLQIFRTYSTAVQRIRLRVRIQETSFRNEYDDITLQDMLKDPGNWYWQDKALDEKFQKCLCGGGQYELCREILQAIYDALTDIKKEMSYFVQTAQTANAEPKGDTATRLREAFRLSFKEKQYKEKLEDLSVWNAEFAHIRTQNSELQQPQHASTACIVRKPLPPTYPEVRQASEKLHDTLEKAWCCSNSSHTGHQAKLLLDAKAKSGIRLDMAISCRQKSSTAVERSPIEPPIWLYVQSITTNGMVPRPALPASSSLTSELSTHLTQTIQLAQNSKGKERDTNRFVDSMKQCVRKAKRVRFAAPLGEEEDSMEIGSVPAKAVRFCPQDPDDESKGATNANDDSNDGCHSTYNLRDAKSICCHLKQTASASTVDHKASCLGYLETDDLFKLVFYSADNKAAVSNQANTKIQKEAIPLQSLLQDLPVIEQFKLAHRLATAVLQYHSTAWLAPDWHLRDLSFFSKPQQSIDNTLRDLQTLHLSTQFPRADNTLTQPMEGVESSATATPSQPITDPELLYGISNLTLANLGLALLEIGYKKEVHSFRHTRDPHDVVTVRKLLAGLHTTLGARYQAIVRKCIYCDFAFGTDLERTELQSAVYSDVVCPLEEMIKSYENLTLGG
ncbi:uncharacterized protein K452DRAFT_350916 [Aplosporella prunicola CBS 121167]|uniref:DUF7580 domain-containing protein n=1 Tax=Aplosporella prunicola CBS 121167 TaxID=1176127 RepID=A0A6A6BGQ5_9PEZI|nr:uncharacterized protein K452DRAFT_350916 [Aplosporella prunicola CBS 121167]KAF2142613.1 hypothetical protein K452DRAFT_350916 [Aplosporella prunicola CBS 121167]